MKWGQYDLLLTMLLHSLFSINKEIWVNFGSLIPYWIYDLITRHSVSLSYETVKVGKRVS